VQRPGKKQQNRKNKQKQKGIILWQKKRQKLQLTYGARKSRKARWTKPKQQKIRQLRQRPRGKWKAIGSNTTTTGTAVGRSGA
jgi:hypothetical protein